MLFCGVASASSFFLSLSPSSHFRSTVNHVAISRFLLQPQTKERTLGRGLVVCMMHCIAIASFCCRRVVASDCNSLVISNR